MPRKVKEELTVVYADEDAAELPSFAEAAVSAEAETATLSEAGPQSCRASEATAEATSEATLAEFVEGAGSSIPEIPWQEVIPKRRGGRQKSGQPVDLKAKTRCEGCGRQMCFHTLKFKHKCPNKTPESEETPAPEPPPAPVPLVRQQTFTLRDQLMEIQRHQQKRREASHVGPIKQFYGV